MPIWLWDRLLQRETVQIQCGRLLGRLWLPFDLHRTTYTYSPCGRTLIHPEWGPPALGNGPGEGNFVVFNSIGRRVGRVQGIRSVDTCPGPTQLTSWEGETTGKRGKRQDPVLASWQIYTQRPAGHRQGKNTSFDKITTNQEK